MISASTQCTKSMASDQLYKATSARSGSMLFGTMTYDNIFIQDIPILDADSSVRTGYDELMHQLLILLLPVDYE